LIFLYGSLMLKEINKIKNEENKKKKLEA